MKYFEKLKKNIRLKSFIILKFQKSKTLFLKNYLNLQFVSLLYKVKYIIQMLKNINLINYCNFFY